MRNDNGYVILAFAIALAIVSGALALTWHALNNCKDEKATITASFNAFKATLAHLTEYQQQENQRIESERKRIDNERAKSYSSTLFVLNAKYQRLLDSTGAGSAGSIRMSEIPSAAGFAEGETRDQRLLQILRIAERQAEQLDAILSWEAEQEAVMTGKPLNPAR